MAGTDRHTLFVGAGALLLVVSVVLFSVSVPAYVTEIETKAPNERSLANATGAYSVSDIEPIPFSDLSPAERTAFERATQSHQNRYADRGASDAGSTFDYRNDIVNRYVVEYDGHVYSVSVVIDADPVWRISSVVGGLVSVPLLLLGFLDS